MQKKQGKYERVILIVMTIIAIAAGGWFIRSAVAFPETLARTKGVEKPFTGKIPVDKIEQATERAAKDSMVWNAPVRANKPVPLFKSVLILLKYAEPENPIDMFTENPQLRPPMTNKWLRESNLPRIGENPAYLVPNVGDLDADDDGFSNKEEFEAQTNPTDPKAHPPVTNKLFLKERVAHNNRVVLRSSSPPFQIATEDQKKRNWFINEGQRFGDGDRFIAGKLEKKVVPDPKLGEKDVSELSVEDGVRQVPLMENGKPVMKDGKPVLVNSKFTLVMGVKTDLADYEAVFVSMLKVQEEVRAMKGDNFRIPSWPDTTYKVIDIQEESAVISPLDDKGEPTKQIIIKKG